MKTEKVSTKKNKRSYIIIALIIILLLLGVGYASFSETLTISGTAEGNMDWDVGFSSESTGNVSENGHTLTVKTDLKYPGDQQKITAIIDNKSSIGIKLTKFELTGQSNTDDITIKKVDLNTNDEKIDAGKRCTYEYVIEWNPNSKKTSVSDTYTFTFEYEQDTQLKNLKQYHRDHTLIPE